MPKSKSLGNKEAVLYGVSPVCRQLTEVGLTKITELFRL